MTRDQTDPVTTYILAKDQSRPWLLRQCFATDARLEVTVRTDAIVFPAVTEGRDAIAETLVSGFSRDYENVLTFCLGSAPSAMPRRFACSWLVAMSRRADGGVRVGCGRYDWQFEDTEPHLACNLTITIERMEILPPDLLDTVMTVISRLPYPWCPATELAGSLAGIPGLAPIVELIAGEP